MDATSEASESSSHPAASGPGPVGVECPCCGGAFAAFEPHGRIPRPGARCPSCGALERHRLIFLYLTARTGFFRDPLRVLHFAPEGCFHRWFRRLPNLDYTSADLMAPHAMERIDITAIPYPEDTFDTVLCSHVLEHVPDDAAAMAEVCRVLKPGGFAILHVPIDRSRARTFEDERIVEPEERERAFGQHDHVRLYGRDFVQRLEAAGFRVRVETFARDLQEEEVRRYGLRRSERIHLCLKAGGSGEPGTPPEGEPASSGASTPDRTGPERLDPIPLPELVASVGPKRARPTGPGPAEAAALQAIPAGTTVLVVSRGDDALLELEGRTGWHFPQAEGGGYAGHHPADSREAVSHLEELKARGAQYLLFPESASWWLDHYRGLREHLDAGSDRVWDEGGCVVYRLGPR